MKKPPDYRPAIDHIAEMLNCLPGKAPERVAELLERKRVRPASEPPSAPSEVLAYSTFEYWRIGWFTDRWYCYPPLPAGDTVAYWQELPAMPEETKQCSGS